VALIISCIGMVATLNLFRATFGLAAGGALFAGTAIILPAFLHYLVNNILVQLIMMFVRDGVPT